MVYFDRPTRFAPGLEQPIIEAVRRGLLPVFALPEDASRTRGSRPMSPEQSRAALRPRPGQTVDLMASEPEVTSPVAIDFGPDGSLWVAEMYDYPLGLDGNYQPGGRVRRLTSSRNDGRFDQSTVFLEDIPFPTGITVWRNGVLVCAAPDILFAADTDGDGRADDIRKLYSGFGTHNYQARVNSLEYGLDGWVYGSCGLFGGKIVNFKGEAFELGDQDFRIRPDTGELEAAVGRTQQGRPRDDAGNWFGCDNSTLCRHYPLPADAVRRNPHVAAPPAGNFGTDPGEPLRLFPARDVQLFKLSGPAGRATAACGLVVYRDELLGADYRGNVFTCEPVNLLVHRMQLVPRGSSFAGQRAPGEEASEFLTSADTWFRPVQARTGPDGALWIVDMYRFIIEHPRWIPPEEVAQLDVRAGHDKGRIYRVRPTEARLPPWVRLDQLRGAELANALDSPNGWQRDMVMQLIVWRRDKEAIPALKSLVGSSSRSWTRLQALATLDVLGEHPLELLRAALSDAAPEVRRHALRIAGTLSRRHPALVDDCLARSADDDPQVRLQLAIILGELPAQSAAPVLAQMARSAAADPFLLGAVASSLQGENATAVLQALIEPGNAAELPPQVVQPVVKTALAFAKDRRIIRELLGQLLEPGAKPAAPWQDGALVDVLETLSRTGPALEQLDDPRLRQQLQLRIDRAREIVANERLDLNQRLRGLGLLGWSPANQGTDRETLLRLLSPQTPVELQAAALTRLQKLDLAETAEGLLMGWRGYSPTLRGRILDTLLSRPGWQKTLLNAVAAGSIAPAEIDVARRERLIRSPSREIRELAAQRLQTKVDPDRAAVLSRYEKSLESPGSPDRGGEIFTKSCAPCHLLEGRGQAVGPDLSIVAAKSARYLLQEILDPNRNTDSRYLGYTALTTDGQTVSGVLAQESATSVTLRGAEGREHTLLRSAIEDLQSTGKSLMPEGLEKDLSVDQMRDLLAYLASRRSPPKQVAGNRPELITPAQGQLALTADHAAIRGGDITFEGAPFHNIGMWHGLTDQLSWEFEWPDAVEVDVWLHWACHPNSEGNRFVMETGNSSLEGIVAGTGGWNRYETRRVGRLTLAAGRQQLSLRPQGRQLKGALLDLQGVYLTPVDDDPVLIVRAPAKPANEPDTPQGAAARILDDQVPEAEREALIRKFLHEAPALMAAMTADLKPGTPEEYRRIPWIWRVAIAAGKQNEAPVLTAILDHVLPRDEQPLRDWQAVVIGGGLINGISQLNQWPGERLGGLVSDKPTLQARWERALEQARAMAEDERVPTGTRYDALRMVPLSGWSKCGVQLRKYLARGVHEELQMGAVSGTVDVNHPEATQALVRGLAGFTDGNRILALDGLLRSPERVTAILEALESGSAQSAWLTGSHRKKLLGQVDPALRRRAEQLVKP
jgi:putative membrane-bound dehydrogenase-like protein